MISDYLQQLAKSLNKTRYYLLGANFFLVFFLILLNNFGIIPLRAGDFAFFAVLTLALALYRPGWAFLFFTGTIPLENINLAPEILGIAVRPYQFIGAITLLAVLVRLLTKRLNFKLPRLNLADYSVIILVFAGFAGSISVGMETHNFASLRLAVISASFVALYFLVRVFIQNIEDLKKIIPFFLSSSMIVIFYGIWQNVRFLHNLTHFETMPGRPNATFSEAEWLGMFIILFISAIFGLIYFFSRNASFDKDFQISNQFLITKFLNYFLLTISFILLTISVSRSAWLGALSSLVIFLWIFFTDLKFREWKWKETIYLKLKIISSLTVALAIVYFFHLTDFQLGNRVQSTGTGLQKITISCPASCRDALQCVSTDSIINSISELEKYGCRHINLEDVESERVNGNIISEVYRKDPNIKLRSEIYQKSWAEIKNHPILGIGWGSVSKILGIDGRGAALNSSNIFLETWLGAGIVGISALIILFGCVIFNAIKNYFYAENLKSKAVNLFIISSWFGLIVFNLFNVGIFLGFFWVWLGVTQIRNENRY